MGRPNKRMGLEMATTSDFIKMLSGHGLTTAKIWYFHPDNPHVVNDNWYVWQDYDTFPHFPILNRFLKGWNVRCEGRVAQVMVAHRRLIQPAEIRSVTHEFRLH
jgi:uncharacterized protein Usg